MTGDIAALLRRCGEALYGSRWQHDLSRALGVSARAVRRWTSGEDRPRPGVWRDLAALLAERLAALAELHRILADELGAANKDGAAFDPGAANKDGPDGVDPQRAPGDDGAPGSGRASSKRGI